MARQTRQETYRHLVAQCILMQLHLDVTVKALKKAHKSDIGYKGYIEAHTELIKFCTDFIADVSVKTEDYPVEEQDSDKETVFYHELYMLGMKHIGYAEIEIYASICHSIVKHSSWYL